MTGTAFTVEQVDRLRFLLDLRSVRSGECLLWIGCTQRDGYGQIHFAGTSLRVHRVALELALGRPLADGMLACHRCDVRNCIEPTHLFEGSVADNVRDMVAKGRQATSLRQGTHTHPESRAAGRRNGKYTKPEATPRGEAHGRAKLSETEVRIIRIASAGGISTHELSRTFDVSRRLIDKIVGRVVWAHVA